MPKKIKGMERKRKGHGLNSINQEELFVNSSYLLEH